MEQKKENTGLFADFPSVSTQEWEDKIKADLKGADYEKKLVWQTLEGFKVKPYYRGEDVEKLKHLNAPPTQYPYIRGNKTDDNNWEIRQDITVRNIAEANRMALDAINRGANSIGFKVKHLSDGVDFSTLLQGINLYEVGINFISASSYPVIIDSFADETDRRKHDSNKIRGSVNFDPISYLLLHGNFYATQHDNFDDAVYLFNTINDKFPLFKIITVNGHHFHNAGADVVQELAFSLASANEYLVQLSNKGLTVDQIAPKMLFWFATGSNYFMEIAKLRAARMLWTKIVEQHKATNEASFRMTIHSSTSSWNKTLYDPHVNILRSATEAMSAAIGGCDSLTIQPFDVNYKEPDDFSMRVAQNIQLVIKEEAYLNKVIDTAAGSYYIENLTDLIADAAWKLFQLIEEKGGFIKAIKENFVQQEIEKTCQQRDMNIATRKQIILGTNQYPNPAEEMLSEIQETKEDFNNEKEKLVNPLKLYRGAEAFEDIRLATEIFIENGNIKPKVFLFTIGNLAMRRARATFSCNFFGCAGYEIIDNNGFETVEEGIKVLTETHSDIVIICSSDDEYAEIVPQIMKRLKEKNLKTIVIVAGNPITINELKAAGVDDFIHIKTNVLETLTKYQKRLGVI